MMPKKPLVGILGFSAIVLLLLGLDYVLLPAWNLQSFGFWLFLSLTVSLLATLTAYLLGARMPVVSGIIGGGGLALLACCLSIGSWLIWPGNDHRLQAQLTVDEGTAQDYISDFAGASLTPRPGATILLPTIDKELSSAQAQGRLGQYGAQYQFDDQLFSSVNVIRSGIQQMVRVSALDYAGFFVALSGRLQGTPGYIEVDQSSGDGRLVEFSEGLRYTPKALFNYDLRRHIRFHFRTALLDDWSFEIDDAGNPWWIVPVVQPAVGLFGGAEVKGTIIVNPISGQLDYHARGSEPPWIDRVVPSQLVLGQANNHFGLKDGWLNRIFGTRKGVFQVSDGYNYVSTVDGALGSTWLITGITSPNEADQTLVGLLTVNLKTKAAKAYWLSGITEMRAREIAENDERVRAQTLTATWPITVVMNGQPAYYLLLKNNVQRQRFVLMDTENGSLVAMADTWEGAVSQFSNLNISSSFRPEDLVSYDGTILRVRDAEDGMRQFILGDEPAIRYQVQRELGNGVLFMSSGDTVSFQYRQTDSGNGVRTVVNLRNMTLGE